MRRAEVLALVCVAPSGAERVARAWRHTRKHAVCHASRHSLVGVACLLRKTDGPPLPWRPIVTLSPPTLYAPGPGRARARRAGCQARRDGIRRARAAADAAAGLLVRQEAGTPGVGSLRRRRPVLCCFLRRGEGVVCGRGAAVLMASQGVWSVSSVPCAAEEANGSGRMTGFGCPP